MNEIRRNNFKYLEFLTDQEIRDRFAIRINNLTSLSIPYEVYKSLLESIILLALILSPRKVFILNG